MARRSGRARWKWVLGGVALAGLAWVGRAALISGPPVIVALESDRTAIGPGTEVVARFEAADWGLGTVRLSIEQGACRVVLAEQSWPRPSPFGLTHGETQGQAELRARVGKGDPSCLAEGTALLRAEADRFAGPLRSAKWSQAAVELPVRFRPPVIGLSSTQHYVSQGGTGLVEFSVSETAVRSGVIVGDREQLSYPRPGGAEGERLTLFGVPWDLGDPRRIRLFAEDDAGNRVERPFVYDREFRRRPARKDSIRLPDAFLERVVPAIASSTPDFAAEGSLLEQYLAINGEMRVRNRRFLAELAQSSEGQRLWDGPFLQLPNSARRAGFAESRTYTYSGRVVDHQTHLGLDLASVAHAEVPAPNRGRVLFAGFLGIYGNAVILDHGFGLLSVCAHLSRIDVEVGQLVEKGEVIGRTGSTGLAGGDHLHLGLFVQGVAVDPMEWLDGRWIAHRLGSLLESGAA